MLPGAVLDPVLKVWRLAGCTAVDGLPVISFQLGGHSFSLAPRQYAVQVSDGP